MSVRTEQKWHIKRTRLSTPPDGHPRSEPVCFPNGMIRYFRSEAGAQEYLEQLRAVADDLTVYRLVTETITYPPGT